MLRASWDTYYLWPHATQFGVDDYEGGLEGAVNTMPCDAFSPQRII